MVQLAPYQYSVIIGLMLSDGWIIFALKNSKNIRLGFKQSVDHANYFFFVFNILSHYCNSYPHNITGIRAGNPYYGLQFFIRSMPCITELYSLFYLNGIKIVPHNIYELLTPIALAYWIMGDGAKSLSGLILCTDSYLITDIVWLINVLIIKYRLECILWIIRKNHYRIYIWETSMPSLFNIVSIYMPSSMLYKIKSLHIKSDNRKKIEVINIKNNTTSVYNSIGEAAKALNINRLVITMYFTRNQVKPYKGLYIFKKID